MAAGHTDLLEDLQKLLGYIYLSDLHSAENASDIKRLLSKIRLDDYSITQWNETIQYILRCTKTFEQPSGVHVFWLTNLNRPKMSPITGFLFIWEFL